MATQGLLTVHLKVREIDLVGTRLNFELVARPASDVIFFCADIYRVMGCSHIRGWFETMVEVDRRFKQRGFADFVQNRTLQIKGFERIQTSYGHCIFGVHGVSCLLPTKWGARPAGNH